MEALKIPFIEKKDINKYLNILFVAYAFSFPVSKALVSLFEILIIFLWIYQGEWKYKYELFKSNRLILSLGALVVFSVISIPWAHSISYGVDYIFKYYHLVMILIFYTALEKKYVKYIFSAFLFSMLISEIMSYGIFFEIIQYKDRSSQFPTPFMHHITYSVVLVFTATILLTSFFTEENKKYKVMYALFFVTIIINLFINGGRTGQVVFIVLTFAMFMSYIEHKIRALILSIVIISATLYLAYSYSSNFHSRVHQFERGVNQVIEQNDYTGQGGMRMALVIIGSQIFLDNPLTGTGLGNGFKEANAYAAQNGFKTKDMTIFTDYHNIFVNQAVHLGIMGFILVIFLMYSVFSIKLQNKQYRVLNRMFIISFVLFSLTHDAIHLMIPMVYFALFAGLFNAISRLESEDKIDSA